MEAQLSIILEDFQTNPFLSSFYQDPAGVSFETEVAFALLHASQLRAHGAPNGDAFVSDFSLILDDAYGNVTLEGKQKEIFGELLNELHSRTLPRSVVILLSCSLDEQLRRIRERGRAIELNITRSYLEALNKSLLDVVRHRVRDVPLIEIHSDEVDFRGHAPQVSPRFSRSGPPTIPLRNATLGVGGVRG